MRRPRRLGSRRLPARAPRPDLRTGAVLDQLGLIRACANVPTAQAFCYSWLGKTLNVITNGSFETKGCSRLRYAATRAACVRGARSYEGALETFS